MCKFLLQFVLSVVFAFFTASSMWVIRELLAIVGFTRVSPCIFGYSHFMMIIVHLGLPLGSLLGIWIANTCLLKASTFSIKGATLGFAFSFLGILLLTILVVIELVTQGPGGEVNPLLRPLRSDLLVVVDFVSAGLLATIGYNLGARGAHPVVSEVPPKADAV